jgi:hypothetical protein
LYVLGQSGGGQQKGQQQAHRDFRPRGLKPREETKPLSQRLKRCATQKQILQLPEALFPGRPF